MAAGFAGRATPTPCRFAPVGRATEAVLADCAAGPRAGAAAGLEAGAADGAEDAGADVSAGASEVAGTFAPVAVSRGASWGADACDPLGISTTGAAGASGIGTFSPAPGPAPTPVPGPIALAPDGGTAPFAWDLCAPPASSEAGGCPASEALATGPVSVGAPAPSVGATFGGGCVSGAVSCILTRRLAP